jgi:tRNA G18 (ribose-2'-O)-methylase SpoU
MTKNKAFVILDNIRSSENVGAIFRTADAVGIEKIYLVGITPTPIDRFGRVQTKIKKTALGSEKTIPWEHVEEIKTLISDLKKIGVKILAIEQGESAIDYKKVSLDSEVAFIFGGEVDGISKDTLSLCDGVIEIPMRGEKESLNVSVSAGIALYRILDV